jgi:hypothetical protein
MVMETKIYFFNENAISFVLNKENGIMVNATEMAKIYNTEVRDFTRLDGTKNFIEACLKAADLPFLDVKTEDDIITSRQKSGTYMHRILALKFAAWLDPFFEVWIYTTIERLLFRKHVEREKSLKKTIVLKNEMEKIKESPKKTAEDFERYLELERLLMHEKAVRKALTSESIKEMNDLFEDEDF